MKHRGFTLIEVLVAMAIFTLIGLASTGVLTTVIDSDELSSERIAKLQHLQRAMLVMERDMLQAVARTSRINGESTDFVMRAAANAFESDADGLGLVRTGWQNPQMRLPRSTLQQVVYRLQDQQLQRLSGIHVDATIGTEPKVRVLLEDIEDFRVEFVSDSSDDDEISWRDGGNEKVLPKGIAITFVSKDFGEIRREWLIAGQGS